MILTKFNENIVNFESISSFTALFDENAGNDYVISDDVILCLARFFKLGIFKIILYFLVIYKEYFIEGF